METREKLGDAEFAVQAAPSLAPQAQQRARVASTTRAPVAASRPPPASTAANRGSKSVVNALISQPKQQKKFVSPRTANKVQGAAAAAAAQ